MGGILKLESIILHSNQKQAFDSFVEKLQKMGVPVNGIKSQSCRLTAFSTFCPLDR
jgi:GH35 family endo-1,4-beta-xylanase